MAIATPDMCTRPLRLPYSLPNILLDDLANVRKEFVMRKSRPSITNVSFLRPQPSDLCPLYVRQSAVFNVVVRFCTDIGRRPNREIPRRYPLSSCSLPGAFFLRSPRPAPSSSGRNYLNQFPSQRQWTVVACWPHILGIGRIVSLVASALVSSLHHSILNPELWPGFLQILD